MAPLQCHGSPTIGQEESRAAAIPLALLRGDAFPFPFVNCHALETIIASYAVPNEMNPVVVVRFCPDGE
jgi:hypothetical protein